MRSAIAVAVVMCALPAVTAAHVTIRPATSTHGSTQTHTVRVPTEGTLAPASVQAAAAPAADDAAAIETWLQAYDAAFNAKDLEKLATFYHPDVTVYEGGGINTGWADYRDRHLGPELKQFQNLQFAHADVEVTPLADGSAAYATAMYSLKAQIGERAIDSGGLATYVLTRDGTGAWKIRHSHTSSRPRRPAR